MLHSGELCDGWEAGRMSRIRSSFPVAISLDAGLRVAWHADVIL